MTTPIDSRDSYIRQQKNIGFIDGEEKSISGALAIFTAPPQPWQNEEVIYSEISSYLKPDNGKHPAVRDALSVEDGPFTILERDQHNRQIEAQFKRLETKKQSQLFYLDSNDLDSLTILARKVSQQRKIIPLDSDRELPARLPSAIDSTQKLDFGMSASEVGLLFSSVFGMLIICTYWLKVQYVHPMIGWLCVLIGFSYSVMGMINRRRLKN